MLFGARSSYHFMNPESLGQRGDSETGGVREESHGKIQPMKLLDCEGRAGVVTYLWWCTLHQPLYIISVYDCIIYARGGSLKLLSARLWCWSVLSSRCLSSSSTNRVVRYPGLIRYMYRRRLHGLMYSIWKGMKQAKKIIGVRLSWYHWPAHPLLHAVNEYVMMLCGRWDGLFWVVVHTLPARWLTGLEAPFVPIIGPDLFSNTPLDFIPETPFWIVYWQVGHHVYLIHKNCYTGHGANQYYIPIHCSSGTCYKFRVGRFPQVEY